MLAFFQAGFIDIIYIGLVARQRIYLREGSTHDARAGHDNSICIHTPFSFC